MLESRNRKVSNISLSFKSLIMKVSTSFPWKALVLKRRKNAILGLKAKMKCLGMKNYLCITVRCSSTSEGSWADDALQLSHMNSAQLKHFISQEIIVPGDECGNSESSQLRSYFFPCVQDHGIMLHQRKRILSDIRCLPVLSTDVDWCPQCASYVMNTHRLKPKLFQNVLMLSRFPDRQTKEVLVLPSNIGNVLI